MKSQTDAFKALPSVDKVLQSVALQELADRVSQASVKLETRQQLNAIRERIRRQDQLTIDRVVADNFFSNFCHGIETAVLAAIDSTLVPVINLTGTVVHTNLGRASLPLQAIAAMQSVASQPVNLEFDLDSGKRGDRDTHLEALLCEITGAEAATVVNNNAAAVLLALNTLARGKDVIISRGELVEIGGAFRIPDVMESANCSLKEVGTTNRTHLSDYEKAISDSTGLIMRVHTSNYEIRGFTNTVPEAELSKLAKAKKLPFVSDLGSGTLVDLRQFGLPYEPTVKETLAQGAEVVTFSGDKLLGGPQAGIIVGNKDLIQQIKSNPLKRALRIDKITMAALLEVIRLYQDPARLKVRLPLLSDLTRTPSEIESVCSSVLPHLQDCLQRLADVESGPCKSQIGSGSLPLDLMESHGIYINPKAEKGQTDALLQKIAKAFRQLPKPVLGRIHDGQLIFDMRCLRDVQQVVDQLPELRLNES